jgi:tetratricopeptide (TPR) repeat protein
MRYAASRFVWGPLLILLFLTTLEAASQSNGSRSAADRMTLWQARQTIMEAGRYMAIPKSGLRGGVLLRVDPSSLRFPTSGFEFDALDPEGGRTHFRVDLSTLESNVKGAWYWCVLLENNGGQPLKKIEDKISEFKVKPKRNPPQYLRGLFVSQSQAATVLGALIWVNPGSSGIQCTGDCAQAEESFFPAINRLRAFAIEQESAAREFPQRAAAWRALSSKPPIPEGVRVERLMAEEAVKAEKLQEALSHYEMGLELYPTWPQGWFNAALISGELGSYADAAEDMQAYLELVPDAKDAQSARDQIAIWQYKAKQSSAN